MKLICDEINQVYIWVDDLNEDDELSPHFDYEEDALDWKDKISKHIITNKLFSSIGL